MVKQFIVKLLGGETRAVNTNNIFSAKCIAEEIWGNKVESVMEGR